MNTVYTRTIPSFRYRLANHFWRQVWTKSVSPPESLKPGKSQDGLQNLGRLNHVALAVPCVRKAADVYQNVFGAKVSEPTELPDHGVTTVFVSLPNCDIELLEPLGTNSPIASFLEKHPSGGMHHICLYVRNLKAALGNVEDYGLRVIGGPENVKIGSHGNPVAFLHPKSTFGTMIELEEEPKSEK